MIILLLIQFSAKGLYQDKHALQYQLHSLCSTILSFFVVDIEVLVFFLIKAFGLSTKLRVKRSYVFI